MQVRFPEENRFPSWKLSFLEYFIAAVFITLLIGYWRLQIGRHQASVIAAERNRIRNLPVIAPRGRILDRQGRVLADNTPAFTILLTRENRQALGPSHLYSIAQGLGLDPTDLASKIEEARRLPRFQPIVIKPAATLADAAFVESHRNDFPELDIIQASQRLYPQHQLAAQVLGYVGEVSADDIAKPNSPYHPGDLDGKFGIEKEYNSLLMGRDGMRRVIVNSRGQEVGSLDTINAIPGHDLRITLDLDLQTAAETALGDQAGAVVALDPRTGEVLAMASHPAFDPNDFASHIDPAEWKKLTSDPQKPLMNKAIQAQLAPGSVFKIIMATAALESGTITPHFKVDDSGETVIYGHVFHSWTFWEHRPPLGSVDLHRAIVQSSDAYFYTVGKMLGIEKIDYYARHLRLGQRTDIDLPGEEPGLIPSPGWVERVFKHPWWPGETISVAIGQGAVMATPVQLAYALGGIASGGEFHRPHLVFRNELDSFNIDPPKDSASDFPLRAQTVHVVTKGMWGVVNENGGTGVGARLPGIDIGGKTGTAQVASEGTAKANRGRYKDNAWFVGLSPVQNPRIAVAVLVAGGEESSVAAPLAAEVIKAFYAEKRKPAPEQNQAQAKPPVQAAEAKGLRSQPQAH